MNSWIAIAIKNNNQWTIAVHWNATDNVRPQRQFLALPCCCVSAAVTEPTGDWGRNIAAIELRQCGLRQSRFQFESCSARGLAGEREREREREQWRWKIERRQLGDASIVRKPSASSWILAARKRGERNEAGCIGRGRDMSRADRWETARRTDGRTGVTNRHERKRRWKKWRLLVGRKCNPRPVLHKKRHSTYISSSQPIMMWQNLPRISSSGEETK